MTFPRSTNRYFTKPTSLVASMSSANSSSDGVLPSGAVNRSSEAATSARDSFPKSSQEPIKSKKPNIRPGITYAAQDDLLKLPIPDLSSTLKKYLQALAPLQSDREHDETRAAARDFETGEGKQLQEKLRKYATGKSSYIEQFWYDSYLNYDNPVVLNLNPFFLLEDDPTPARNNQVTRAASLVISALCFVRAVRKEELPPDTVRGKPLCMHQFSRMFGTARVPTDNGCIIGQDSDAKHMVVLCRGQFYWFDVLDDNHDLIMTEKDVAINLQSIVDDAEHTPIQEAAKSAVGVLSTENRKIWAGLRDVLTREEGSNNADCLNMIDSELFVLCLDYTKPASVPSAAQSAASTAVATVSATVAAFKEVTETSSQTAREAASGDRVAQRLLAKNAAATAARNAGSTENASTTVKTSPQSGVSARGSIIDEKA